MTPGDLIADLRDIHTPPAAGDAAFWLSPTPLILFAALIALGAVWSHRRRTAWRREAAERLGAARKIADPARRWTALVALYRGVARQTAPAPPPDDLFQPVERVGEAAERRLIADIERRLG